MRRRKKDKTHDKISSLSSTDDVLDFSGRGKSSKLTKNGDSEGSTGPALVASSSKGGSPPQQRKRSLLGLGSMRDLVEQVQDTLTKGNKQEQTAAAVGAGSTHSSAEKSSRGHKTAAAATAGVKSSSATPSDKSAPTTPASLAAAAAAITDGGVRATSIPGKKKVLDLKLLPSGSSLALRMKKQTQFTPSPSEFKARERPDTTDQPFCGVCAAPFTLMVRRQRCQVCGESVCAQCSSDKRHVEGQKGLQRVCDICIVEGPVVLDENGMYAVAPSPAATPIATPRLAPSSSIGLSPAHHAVPPASSSSSTTTTTTTTTTTAPSNVGQGGGYIRTLFADTPSSKSKATKSSSHREGSSGGGLMAGANTTRPVHPTKSPAVASSRSGNVGVSSRRAAANGCAGGASGNGTEVHGASKGAARAKAPVARAAAEAAEAAADAAAVAAAAALGDDDDGDEGGPPSSAAPAKARKRSKKARRAGAASEARASADRRQQAASGQSFSEYLGIGGGNSTPASRSTKSTPRSGSGGSFCNGTGVASSATAAHGGGGGGGSGGGGATRKWESTGKKRSSGGGSAAGKGPGEAVGQGSGFVRDFIRGAGIHRLDPRRLAGPLTVCASWTGLDKTWASAWTLARKLLESQGRASGGGGGGRSRKAGGGRSGNGHYSSHGHHHSSSMAAGRRWRPGRRVSLVAALVLLASYRRYQVTHPEITTEHVLGAATSLFLALAGFLAHAVLDLARDACGAVVPSLCGTRETRLGGEAGVGSGGEEGVLSGEKAEGDVVGKVEGGGATGIDEGGERVEGHELDQYFFL